MRLLLPVTAFSLFLLTAVPAFSYLDKAVLGTSNQLSDAVFPPVTAGPGHILPDSPFYFVDKLYQEFRLALVFTPENRAELHVQIAYERLAELRVEASRNNQKGADAALIELEHESMAAAQDVRDASSQGKDVTQLARDIHQAITDYRTVIDTVAEEMPNSSFSQKLTATSGVLRDARVVSEDALPQGDIQHEIASNINQEVDTAVLGIATSTKNLQAKLSIYEKYASNSASDKVVKAREVQIASLKKQIAALQSQLDRLLVLQKQATNLKVNPKLNPSVVKLSNIKQKALVGAPTPSLTPTNK